MPLAWGHTRLLETDWRLITQESHCFSCGSVNFANQAYCDLVGRDRDQVVGRSLWQFINPENHACVRAHLENLKETGELQTYADWLRDSSGRKRWFEWIDYPVLDKNGNIVEYQSVGRDMTQRKETEEKLLAFAQMLEQKNLELDAAVSEARNANEAKSRYLAHMNHEVRTPLNGFMGFLELLETTVMDEEQQEYVQYLRQSTRHMLSIVNNVLDYAKIEAGEMQLDQRPFSLADEVQAALAPIRSLALQQGLSLELELAQDLPQTVVGDAQRLRQIFLNLAGNAVKFTQEGKVHISLTCTETDLNHHTLRLVVTDTGSGMTPKTIDSLFQPFYQAEGGTTPHARGTGLGLAITKELVELMKGTITVESVLGEGTRATVDLVLMKA